MGASVSIILHHYPLSPFSEKVRLALGMKRAAWRSVTIPVWMPKPDLMPLTGGYRRAPVMQVGADVYCDTLLILREIERLHPEPTFYPAGGAGLASAVGWWAEKFTFMPSVCLVASLIGEHFPAELIEERKPFFGVDLSKQATLPQQHIYRQKLHAHLTWLADILADGRAFLLGPAPSAADLSAYHPIWFALRNAGSAAEAMLPMAPLRAWHDRVAAFGHGEPQETEAAEALEIAREHEPAEPGFASLSPDPSGCAVGDRVTVAADDTGRDPVTGELVACGPEEMVVRHFDPRVGAINLHFPRAGFDLSPAA
jgi:glutathione S-transferase